MLSHFCAIISSSYILFVKDNDEEDIHRDDIGEFIELPAKIGRSPAMKNAKKAAKNLSPADGDDDDDEFSGERGGEMRVKPPNARSVNKRSGKDRADPEMPRTKKTRNRMAETAKHINEMGSAPAEKETSMMIVELGDEHTKCIICYDKFSTDVDNEDDGTRRHLPVLSSSQRCDHW